MYAWAGQFRTVNMCKNLSSFADVGNGEVDRYLDDVRLLLRASTGRTWTVVALRGQVPRSSPSGAAQERRSATRRCVGGEIERRLGQRPSRPEGGGVPYRARGPR